VFIVAVWVDQISVFHPYCVKNCVLQFCTNTDLTWENLGSQWQPSAIMKSDTDEYFLILPLMPASVITAIQAPMGASHLMKLDTEWGWLAFWLLTIQAMVALEYFLVYWRIKVNREVGKWIFQKEDGTIFGGSTACVLPFWHVSILEHWQYARYKSCWAVGWMDITMPRTMLYLASFAVGTICHRSTIC